MKLGTINAVLSTWHLRWSDRWQTWERTDPPWWMR